MTKMMGQVYRYDWKTQEGIIISRDNKQYKFSATDYIGMSELNEGNIVEFEADGQNARKVRLLTGSAG